MKGRKFAVADDNEETCT